MKKITLLVFILTAYIGYSQATHTIDFEPAGVGSMWSWTATEVAPGFDEIANPVSGGINTSATVVEFIAHTTDNPWALCWTDDNNTFTFDGTNSTVKIMVYKPTISNVGMKFEGASPAIELTVPNTVINQWEELTFDFSGQIGNTYNKIVVIPDFDFARATDNTLYFDNIKVPEGAIAETCSDGIMNQDETGVDCGGVCAPCATPPVTAAPTPPARLGTDVESIYSDAYAPKTFDNFSAGWCGPGAVTEVTVDGNLTQKFSGAVGCQGIDFQSNRLDLSTFTHFHVDFYTDETDLIGKVFNLKLVDWASGGGEASNLQININDGTTPGVVTGSWVSVDIDLTSGDPVIGGSSLTRSDIAQIGVTSNLPNVWYDNMYFHKNTTLGVEDNELASFEAYPNPTKDSWTVKTKNQIIKTVQVFDVLGKEVMNIKPNLSDVSIDASTLPKGLYFAKMTTDLGSNSIKLIKN